MSETLRFRAGPELGGVTTRRAAKRPARTIIRQVHLWLGLTIGLLFAMLGLTGSALVFYVEIDGLLHRQSHVVAEGAGPGWSSPVWDRALSTVHTRWPSAEGQWRFEVTGEAGAIPSRYYGDGGHSHSMMVWLSPDGSRVLRREQWGEYLMTWIYDLHMNLLAGDFGKQVAGWSGIAILTLLLTGLAVWWPRGTWRKALAFKRQAAPLRRLRDWHKLSGLWGLPVLIILVATGVLLALPQERDWVLTRTLAPLDAPVTPAVAAGEGAAQPLSRLLESAHRAVPDARLVWIEIPGDASAPVRFRVQVPGDPSRRFPRSYIHVDRHSAAVVAVVDYRKSGASSAFNTWLHPLHDGSIGGLPVRILVFLFGLVPPALFVTGLLHWLRRRKAARRSHTDISRTYRQGA